MLVKMVAMRTTARQKSTRDAASQRRILWHPQQREHCKRLMRATCSQGMSLGDAVTAHERHRPAKVTAFGIVGTVVRGEDACKRQQ
jgi:hypothetical protein